MRMKNINLFPSLFLPNKHKQLWLWPSCNHPKTLSFRATAAHDSVSIDPKAELLAEAEVELLLTTTTPDSCFTNSSESASISTESEKYFDNNECCSSVETIVRGARSERLFFQPDPTSSILETQGKEIGGGGGLAYNYKESVVMEMESDNPYGDFKKSMEEMVESHDLKDWDCLEELLRWYLRMNGKNNHEIIVGAFVDLLSRTFGGGGGGDGGGGGGGGGGGAGGSCSDHSTTASFTSAVSTLSSPISSSSPLCDQVDKQKIIKEGKMTTRRPRKELSSASRSKPSILTECMAKITSLFL